jgi:hypothetical protein
MRPHVNEKKLGMVVRVCHPSEGGKLKIEDHSPGRHGEKVKPYFQHNQSKKS